MWVFAECIRVQHGCAGMLFSHIKLQYRRVPTQVKASPHSSCSPSGRLSVKVLSLSSSLSLYLSLSLSPLLLKSAGSTSLLCWGLCDAPQSRWPEALLRYLSRSGGVSPHGPDEEAWLVRTIPDTRDHGVRAGGGGWVGVCVWGGWMISWTPASHYGTGSQKETRTSISSRLRGSVSKAQSQTPLLLSLFIYLKKGIGRFQLIWIRGDFISHRMTIQLQQA